MDKLSLKIKESIVFFYGTPEPHSKLGSQIYSTKNSRESVDKFQTTLNHMLADLLGAKFLRDAWNTSVIY